MASQSLENEEKAAYFQDVTGVQDEALATQMLEAHGWDLDAAVSSMVSDPEASSSVANAADAAGFPPIHPEEARLDSENWGSDGGAAVGAMDLATTRGGEEEDEAFDIGRPSANPSPYQRLQSLGDRAPSNRYRYEEDDDDGRRVRHGQPWQGMAWRLVTLPFSVVRGSYNLMYGAVGLGIWAAGGMLSYSLGALGLLAGLDGGNASRALLPVSTGAAEADHFVRNFEREYGENHPSFQTMSFMEALRRAGQQYKFLFVYLHSPDHANTPTFCESTLCSEAVVRFLNENFVAWGGDVRTSEGFQMSNTFKASTFPFCAVATASSNQRIALLQQIEGPRTANELLAVLQRVVDEQGAVLVASRVEEEERQLNRRLREEQDVAYQAALRADQERERRRQEEADRAAGEAKELERKRLEEEEAVARVHREAADKVLSLERRRQEKAAALGVEPEKGSDVTQVQVRLPDGVRKERRFYSDDVIQKVYDYVDSLDSLNAEKYSLVSNFPKIVYGPDKLGLSLKAAGLHPHASLFVQVDDT